MNSFQSTVGRYLIEQLKSYGVKHVFGVPGDYIFDLLDIVIDSEVRYIGTCNEINAGYAADAYARIAGLGCALVTYAVGSLSVVNAIAGAYAEKVPLVVISGGPAKEKYLHQKQVHHTLGLGKYSTPLDIFKSITVDAECIMEASKAQETIDRILTNCLKYSRPVYIEIPANIAREACMIAPKQKWHQSYSEKTSQAVTMTNRLLTYSKRPLIIVGFEISRFKLVNETMSLIKKANCPYSVFITDRTTLTDTHHNFIGYCGPGTEMARLTSDYLESADFILCLGSPMGRDHLRATYPKIRANNIIYLTDGIFYAEQLQNDIDMVVFIQKLEQQIELPTEVIAQREILIKNIVMTRLEKQLNASNDRNVLNHEVFCQQISSFLEADDIVISDTGSSLISVRDIGMPEGTLFISQPYYCSIGYSLPAALGVCLAHPKRSVILIIGDGAFQMTSQALSSIIRYQCKLIIIVVNNNGYTIERALHTDAQYNDIQSWSYYKLPENYGGHAGYLVQTVDELDAALNEAKKMTWPVLIDMKIDQYDWIDNLQEVIEP